MAILAGIGILILLVVAGVCLFVDDLIKALELFDEQADWDY